MAEDWLADVRKYASNADEAVVRAIERYLGIALRNRDSSLVSFSDSTETDRVRNNFLKKKLALTDPDSVLDAAIAAVGERMKGDPTKNRVTVYYLLAEHFGKLGLFGGSGSATAAKATPEPAGSSSGAAAAGLAAAGLAAGAAGAAGEAAAVPTAPAATVASAPAATAPAGTAAAASGTAYPGDDVGGSSRFADVPDDDDNVGGGSKWWLWLLLALALIALFLALRSCMSQPAVTNTSDETTINSTTDTTVTTSTDTGNTLDGNATVPADVTTATPPAGAAVIAGTRAGLPMLTVYFDTGKAAVTKDFTTVAAPIKTYVAANPGAKLAVSGFNDASGNAAANAELSKNRAKAVQAALTAAGVPAGAVVLEKPADTTVGGTNDAAARRVEVTVKQ